MRTLIRNTFIPAACLVLLAGCLANTKTGVENNIRFAVAESEKTYHLLNNPENPNCNLQIAFTYPQDYDDKEILKKIQTLFVSSYFGEAYETYSPQEVVERYAKEYLDVYKELENDFKEEIAEHDGEQPPLTWFSCYETSSNKIIFNKDGLLGYSIAFENYTGGAHGSHALSNHVINLKTGQFITEADLFAEGFEDELSRLLVSAIAIQNGVEDPKGLEDIGFFSIEEIYPNGNFLIDEKGITYSFNEYEIAAYVVGTVNVPISCDKLTGLLRNNSLTETLQTVWK
ncbi:hypothetical protein Barb7_00712 [Bacteroidales bacterium Barb7]|nr:hypothetical protein Barb7_00712 [Bacteroidales bacterium Barb7]